MGWMEKLCETYDYAIERGAAYDENNPLPEMGFTMENVQAEVRLTEQGEFYDAVMIPLEKRPQPVPATPYSIVARGAPVQPHPIFDKVKELCTERQLSILNEWCKESDVPDDVKIIYSYLSKKTLCSDLKKEFEKKGIKDDPEKTFVCFIISDKLMKSRKFILSWKKHFYTLCRELTDDICYATGEITGIARKHPFAFGTNMLVSMVDENCYGRFGNNAQNAVSIGLETTLKAHHTRRWLMKRQGRRLYGMEFVAWDTFDFDRELPFDGSGYGADELKEDMETGEIDAKALAKASDGIWSRKIEELQSYSFDELSTIVVMGVDSATGKGRASIVYYQEFEPQRYLDNLMNWYHSCIWIRYAPQYQDYVKFTPSIDDICNLIYGAGDDKSILKLKKNLCKELISCITACRHLPKNIIMAGFCKAANPFSFRSKNGGKWSRREWEKAVSVICAMINKKNKEEGDDVKMALDENDTNRDYLYGRLLAIADMVEYFAMKPERGDEKTSDDVRMTNAMRYMQRYVQKPADTWLMLRTQLLAPYFNRLNTGSRIYYERAIEDIESRIVTEDISNKPLGPRFLQGFSCQKMAGKKSSGGKDETITNDDLKGGK